MNILKELNLVPNVTKWGADVSIFSRAKTSGTSVFANMRRGIIISIKRLLPIVKVGVLSGAIAMISNGWSHADQKADLDTKLDTIDTQVNTVAKGVQHLEDITNLSQGVLLVGSIIPASAGQTVSMDITLVSGSFNPTSLQATIEIPPGFTLIGCTAGPAAVAAQKQVVVNAGTFLTFGINQTVIHSGIVATAEFTLSPTLAKRKYPIVLSNPVVSDANGQAITVSAVSGTVINGN